MKEGNSLWLFPFYHCGTDSENFSELALLKFDN